MTCEYVILQKKTKPMLDGLEQRGAGVYIKIPNSNLSIHDSSINNYDHIISVGFQFGW